MKTHGLLFFQSAFVYAREIDYGNDSVPTDASDWTPIARATYYQNSYLIEARQPSFSLSLRFNPTDETSGSYQVVRHQDRETESGSLYKVQDLVLIDDEGFITPTTIKDFELRFRLVTLKNDRQRTKCVWFVGLSQPEEISDDPEAEQGAAANP
jgi:hypothetical protein